ncbi:FtsX-like permease family protein [Pseudoalteromonas sp. MMG005]|uniref:ABC transporter permease n=1 Tax=Pseudoalteromonas sp. MMG005 TaxID=2822682 RepID=UPI001B3A0923|nr:FtsX-like permease family protein [Pseudoalteromonas sp. MMG005]MBQ4846014.1 FtsX-like permease family protein [Pseudoalteromonas sp. MMG005]
MRDFLPIVKTFKKKKTTPALLAFQIAVTFMVLVNAIYMISERNDLIASPVGVDIKNTLTVITNLSDEHGNLVNQLEDDLLALKNIPGVINAAPMTALPLEGWGSYIEFKLVPDEEYVAFGGYFGSNEDVIDALGLTLVAGENFSPSDIQTAERDGIYKSAKILITRALAEKISPDDWRDILGKNIYFYKQPHEVIGIIERLQNAWSSWSAVEYTVISSVRESNHSQRYIVRVEPDQMDYIIKAIPAALLTHAYKRIETIEPLSEVKKRSYQEDLATNQLLTSVCIGLTIITLFGILGQARFTINRRVKQIGTRRALGASKSQVVRYFMLENAIISTIGVVIGILTAIILNNQFVELLAITPVPLNFLLFGAIAIVLLGQIAVAYPVSQAAKVSPAITTRGA